MASVRSGAFGFFFFWFPSSLGGLCIHNPAQFKAAQKTSGSELGTRFLFLFFCSCYLFTAVYTLGGEGNSQLALRGLFFFLGLHSFDNVYIYGLSLLGHLGKIRI
jgi:hypothetical protein